jgi:UDP-galactopyranose mutase
MKLYDYLVVGSGFSGAVFAREMTDAGKHVLVIDRRRKIGGNAHTARQHDIDVHVYGAHIFHTHNKRVWQWINRFATFNNYRHTVKAQYKQSLYSFPINLMTLQQMWGVSTPSEAEAALAAVRISCSDPQTLEEYCLATVGREIYQTFIEGYTTKQWSVHPRDLPKSLIQRIPVRTTFDDSYFHTHDKHQGIPEDGYTAVFRRMLEGIEVRLGVDFLDDVQGLSALAGQVVYTGPVDQLLGYRHGQLGYRSLKFVNEFHHGDYQGCAIVNHTEFSVPYTRVIEHKHFALQTLDHTIITREYPQEYTSNNEPFYPLADPDNLRRYTLYAEEAKALGYILIGRLATYKYLDMDSCIGMALVTADRELRR